MREKHVGFVGLGRLGSPMAANLLAAGYALTVSNRTASKADPLVAKGATFGARPADVVSAGGVVVSCVWNDEALEETVRSDGFADALGKGGLHISTSTVTPEAAQRVAAFHAARGSSYVEAPIFGRPEAAAAKQLWVPIAGEKAAKERARPILEALGAQGIFDFGEEPGAAVTVKIAGNFLLISAARSFIEAARTAEANGVTARAFVEMMTSTLFDAPIYRGYGKMLVDGNLSITTSAIAKKDVLSFEGLAKEKGGTTPIAARLSEMMRDVELP